jgi:hypothetical protein
MVTYLPITCGTEWRKFATKSIESKDSVVQKYLPTLTYQGALSLLDQPGIQSKVRDVERPTDFEYSCGGTPV